VSKLDPSRYFEFEHVHAHNTFATNLPKGVIVESLPVAAKEQRELVEPYLFKLLAPDRDRFSALHSALFTGGNFVYVPDGVVIEEPIRAENYSKQNGSAVLPHTVIVAGKNSRFNYLDEYIAEDDNETGYRSGSAEIFLLEGAEVGYVSVQKWGRNTWHFGDQRAQLGKDATLKLFNVTLGGKFSKNRVEASLAGEGAEAELKAIYFASGEQFFDFHTLQDHRVGNTRSDLLFKGALSDVARTVYAGLIRIEKHAARSDAYQANRNLVLSDHAKATSIPMLEIDNNDVRCTHGATVGPVDPNHLFYLRSRGIPEATAKRMLIQGFFGDVLDRIPFEHARKLVEAELESRIG
jgi:Fe-S cluster assembly protein SufD